jgi:signal transduction histidine kinase
LEAALEDVTRLEKLTHSMLRLARAEQVQTAKGRDDLPSVDLVASCEQSADSLRAIADAKSIQIEIRAKQRPRVRADAEDLEMIWNNLIENALRYSPKDSSVVVDVQNDAHEVRVEVRDKGPGIPQEDLERIFKRFHRADQSRARETGGYGLGLAIVKTLAEAYGGTIDASSNGGGANFTVRLPISSN